ncbi:MAG: hypothetical protein V7L23_35225 [Nostoc sp.]|uniref:hypothetical protein n=1 Tax=Nostoc sp. TaxID=1180 RepID=UPI002FF185C9
MLVQGSRGAGEQGSRGAGEQGSRGAGEQGRVQCALFFPLCPSAPLPLRPSAPLPLCPSAPLPLCPSAFQTCEKCGYRGVLLYVSSYRIGISKSVLIFPAMLRNFNVGCVVAKRRTVNNLRCVSLRRNTPYS